MSLSHYIHHKTRDATATASSGDVISWTGAAGDGLWENATNWGGTVPGASDTAIVAATADSITTQSLPVIGTLGSLRFGTGFTGTFNVPVAASLVYIRRRQGGAITLGGNFDRVYILDTSAGGVTFSDDFEINLGLHVINTRGAVALGDDGKLADAYVHPSGRNRFSKVTMGTGIGSPNSNADVFERADSAYVGDGGFIETASGIASVNLGSGGVYTTSGGVHKTVQSSGIFRLRGGSIGTGGAVLYMGGGLHLKNYLGSSPTATIDNLTMYGGSGADLRTGLDQVVVTSDVTYYGGQLRVEKGQTITPS